MREKLVTEEKGHRSTYVGCTNYKRNKLPQAYRKKKHVFQPYQLSTCGYITKTKKHGGSGGNAKEGWRTHNGSNTSATYKMRFFEAHIFSER